MTNFKKFRSFLTVCLILSVVLGNFSLPVLAFGNDGVNFEQVKTKAVLNNSMATFNKADSLSKEIKNFSPDPSINIKEKNGLEKSQQIKENETNYIEGEIIVKYKNTKINLNTASGRATALNFNNSKFLEKKEELRKNNTSVLKIKDAKTVEQKIAELKNDPNVEYAQPNYQYYPTEITTNDTFKNLLWGLDNTGQTINGSYGNITGTSDADIDAPEAWAISEGSENEVIVAVIDSGVAYNHPDLAANMWDGISCKDENGNVLGECNHGYDYEDNDKIPLPTSESHGTHIAGTIAAVINNGKGIIGVAPNAKIMALKSSLTTSDNVKAINFAKYNGAKVINASWGGSNFDQALKDAIDSFPGIFVAAAGNCGDVNTFLINGCTSQNQTLYPASYDSSNIISVANTDQNDNLNLGSNYSATSVDVGAPGTNIYSTIADSPVMSENFNSVTAPNLPNGWTKTGDWGTYDYSGDKVLYGDYSHTPYLNNADSIAVSPTYNLGENTGAKMSFFTRCDTEYTTTNWYDYMALEVSSDGANFTELTKWDEATLDIYNGENPLNSTGGAVFSFDNLSIPSQYLTSHFKFRFKWHTDSSNVPVQNYDGCWVDDVKITKFSDGSDEKYDYMDGTSMATPHVAGLAALIEGYNPNLTLSQVKNIILTTGDSLVSLSGKTVSGKRINAQKALEAVNPAKAITAFSFPEGEGVINETNHTIAVTVPFGTDVTALVPTIITSAGASVSPISGVAQDFTSPVPYTVMAADGSTQTYIVTVNFTVPSTIATVTSEVYTVDDAGSIITGIPYATASSTFLAGLTKGESHQIWDISGLANPVVTGNALVVTAQDSSTVKTYTLSVALNSAKAITAFSFPEGEGVINEIDHTIVVTVPFGTNVASLVPTIATSTGASVSPASDIAQDFTNPLTYTVTAQDGSTQSYTVMVTLGTNPDIALVAADKAALVDDSIKGVNFDLSNIIVALTNPLPSLGANGSTIIWASNNEAVISNDGQTVVRPTFVAGNTTVTMTATIVKGAITDTKVFTLTVIKLPASNIATVTSETYNVSDGGTASETIINIPFGASKADFLAALTKGEANQIWNDAGITDPVITGNTLVVTAQDGTTIVTYTVTAALNPAKAITTFNFATPAANGVINETTHTIAVAVPFGTVVTALTPTIVVSIGASVSPASGVVQDFTNSVIYTVTAADSSTQTYEVTVTVAANTAKDITSFNFTGLTPIINGVISGTDITLSVRFGTDVTALIPTITTTGESVNPTSGTVSIPRNTELLFGKLFGKVFNKI
jgi:subtilisin family serine protease